MFLDCFVVQGQRVRKCGIPVPTRKHAIPELKPAQILSGRTGRSSAMSGGPVFQSTPVLWPLVRGQGHADTGSPAGSGWKIRHPRGNFSVQGRVGNKVGHYVSAVLGNPGRMLRRFKAKAEHCLGFNMGGRITFGLYGQGEWDIRHAHGPDARLCRVVLGSLRSDDWETFAAPVQGRERVFQVSGRFPRSFAHVSARFEPKCPDD